MNPDERRGALLESALEVARRVGLHGMTREKIARQAGVSTGLISERLGKHDAPREAVQALARRRGIKLAAFGPAEGDREERVWMAAPLSTSTSYRLLVTGPMGVSELAQLLGQLQGQAARLSNGDTRPR